MLNSPTASMRMRLLGFLLPISLLVGCGSVQTSERLTDTLQGCSAKLAQQNQTGVRTIAPTDLKVGQEFSTPVISNAQKFILPVPALGMAGEPLVYPAGYEKAGQPIVDYKGEPIGDRGLVFFNGKDKSWQAVKGDGEGAVIINEVTQEQAQKLYEKVQSLKPDPNQLTLDELKQVLTFAQQQLGLVDMYNSTQSFVQEKMTPVIAGDIPMVNGKEVAAYGFKKRDERDINQAIYIPGTFVFQGPAASPQKFEQGGVIVEQGGKMRGVQPDIFVRTYQLSDGRAIAEVSTALKTQCE